MVGFVLGFVLLGSDGVAVFILDVGFDGVGGREVLVLDVLGGEAETGDVGACVIAGDFALGKGGEDPAESDLDGGKVFKERDFNAAGRWRRGWFFAAFGHAVGGAVMEVEEAVVLLPDTVGAALDSIGAEMTALAGHGISLPGRVAVGCRFPCIFLRMSVLQVVDLVMVTGGLVS